MRSSLSQNAVAAYEAFKREFRIVRNHEDTMDYHSRAALLEKRRQEVRLHNSKNASWFAAINKLADFTDEEFHSLLGHRHSRRGRDSDAPPSSAVSFLQTSDKELARTVDWRSSLNGTEAKDLLVAKDQGACGSCWAVAATGALEMHTEIAAKGKAVPPLSYEQLVDCVENLQECGGTGGCKGATTELAYEYVVNHGIGRKQDYKGYQSGGSGKCSPASNPAVTIGGFVRLPENQPGPLLEALAEHGPVAISADASKWLLYGGGVYGGCNKNAIINHAVLAMGYGTDDKLKKDYWLIRNSWGADWGEHGYIRLLRHQEGEDYCGVDTKPLEGVGCKGGPAELPVCGMCGMLADSAYPTDVQVM